MTRWAALLVALGMSPLVAHADEPPSTAELKEHHARAMLNFGQPVRELLASKLEGAFVLESCLASFIVEGADEFAIAALDPAKKTVSVGVVARKRLVPVKTFLYREAPEHVEVLCLSAMEVLRRNRMLGDSEGASGAIKTLARPRDTLCVSNIGSGGFACFAYHKRKKAFVPAGGWMD